MEDGLQMTDRPADLTEPDSTKDQTLGGNLKEGGQLTPMPTDTYHKLKNIDRNDLLQQYRSGITIPEIAKRYSVDKARVSRVLRELSGDQWQAIKEEHYETLLDDGLLGVREAA